MYIYKAREQYISLNLESPRFVFKFGKPLSTLVADSLRPRSKQHRLIFTYAGLMYIHDAHLVV